LDERDLGQDGVAADTRDYYVDIWRVMASVTMTPEESTKRGSGMEAPLYALLTSASLDRSPVKISAPWLFRESTWEALLAIVAEDVRIAMRPKLDLALRIALVIGVPITPVAPMTSIFRGMLSDKSTPPWIYPFRSCQLALEYKGKEVKSSVTVKLPLTMTLKSRILEE
jgi:hypothetical protein